VRVDAQHPTTKRRTRERDDRRRSRAPCYDSERDAIATPQRILRTRGARSISRGEVAPVSVRPFEFGDLLLRVGELEPEFADRRRRWRRRALSDRRAVDAAAVLCDAELGGFAPNGVERSAQPTERRLADRTRRAFVDHGVPRDGSPAGSTLIPAGPDQAQRDSRGARRRADGKPSRGRTAGNACARHGQKRRVERPRI